jgi:hypothetical protein
MQTLDKPHADGIATGRSPVFVGRSETYEDLQPKLLTRWALSRSSLSVFVRRGECF